MRAPGPNRGAAGGPAAEPGAGDVRDGAAAQAITKHIDGGRIPTHHGSVSMRGAAPRRGWYPHSTRRGQPQYSRKPRPRR